MTALGDTAADVHVHAGEVQERLTMRANGTCALVHFPLEAEARLDWIARNWKRDQMLGLGR